MPIISVERYDPKTHEVEDYLINTDFIVFAKELGPHKVFGALTAMYLASKDAIAVVGTLEQLEASIYWASQHNSKPASLEGNPWQTRKSLT